MFHAIIALRLENSSVIISVIISPKRLVREEKQPQNRHPLPNPTWDIPHGMVWSKQWNSSYLEFKANHNMQMSSILNPWARDLHFNTESSSSSHWKSSSCCEDHLPAIDLAILGAELGKTVTKGDRGCTRRLWMILIQEYLRWLLHKTLRPRWIDAIFPLLVFIPFPIQTILLLRFLGSTEISSCGHLHKFVRTKMHLKEDLSDLSDL